MGPRWVKHGNSQNTWAWGGAELWSVNKMNCPGKMDQIGDKWGCESCHKGACLKAVTVSVGGCNDDFWLVQGDPHLFRISVLMMWLHPLFSFAWDLVLSRGVCLLQGSKVSGLLYWVLWEPCPVWLPVAYLTKRVVCTSRLWHVGKWDNFLRRNTWLHSLLHRWVPCTPRQHICRHEHGTMLATKKSRPQKNIFLAVLFVQISAVFYVLLASICRGSSWHFSWTVGPCTWSLARGKHGFHTWKGKWRDSCVATSSMPVRSKVARQ